MASSSKPRYDSYQSSPRRKKVAVSSSPATAPSLRPSARKRAGSARQNVEPTRKTTRESRQRRAERPRSEKQKLADIKRQERQRRQRERFFRRIFGITLLVVLVGGLIAGALYLVNSPVFDVTSLSVKGNKYVSSEDVKSLADVSSSSSLLLLNKSDIVGKLRQQPWIRDVELTKQLPHTLTINVIERTPQAVAVLPGEKNYWLVSDDGVWLGKLDVTESSTISQSDAYGSVVYDAKKVIHIIDLPIAHPRAGSKVKSPEVVNALRVVNGVSPELRKITAKVSAPTVPKTKIFTESGIEISLGSSEDIKTKDRIVRSILKTQKGKVVLINVRAIDAPTWRGLNEN